jgi:cadmium resistance protein CadD (predicted permease)
MTAYSRLTALLLSAALCSIHAESPLVLIQITAKAVQANYTMTAPRTREAFASGIHSASGRGFDLIKSSARFADYIDSSLRFTSPIGPGSTSAFSVHRFIANVMGAMVLVLIMCSDDVVWLLPFFVGDEKHWYALFYIFTMFFMWLLSSSITFSVQGFAAAHADTPIGPIAETISAVVLILLTLKLFIEWYYEEDDDDDDDEKENSAKGMQSYSKLFFVAFAGNLDNIGVYIPILLHAVFGYWELLIGVLSAAIIIAAITLGLSQLQSLIDVITKVPLWMIVGILTLYVAFTAFVDVNEASV